MGDTVQREKAYKDVTSSIVQGTIDDEFMAIECKCGFGKDQYGVSWEFSISIYKDDPDKCPKCGREYYWVRYCKIYMREP